MQQQAGALVEKDQQIAALEQRVSDLEAPQALGKECGESNSADDGHAWESLPPPESFKEALEQILMLQVPFAMMLLHCVSKSFRARICICRACSEMPFTAGGEQ